MTKKVATQNILSTMMLHCVFMGMLVYLSPVCGDTGTLFKEKNPFLVFMMSLYQLITARGHQGSRKLTDSPRLTQLASGGSSI